MLNLFSENDLTSSISLSLSQILQISSQMIFSSPGRERVEAQPVRVWPTGGQQIMMIWWPTNLLPNHQNQNPNYQNSHQINIDNQILTNANAKQKYRLRSQSCWWRVSHKAKPTTFATFRPLSRLRWASILLSNDGGIWNQTWYLNWNRWPWKEK